MSGDQPGRVLSKAGGPEGELFPFTSVTIRMMLPNTRPMALLCRVEDLADDEAYRTRMHQITSRHAYAILESVEELARLGRIQKGSAQIRAHQLPPLFKMYILNGDEVFFGLYPLVKHAIPFPGGQRDIFDLMGKDAMVFRHTQASGEAAEAQFIEQAERPGGVAEVGPGRGGEVQVRTPAGG